MGSETEGRSESRRESKLPDTNESRRIRGSTKKQTENEEIETLSKSQPSSNDTQRFVPNSSGECVQGSGPTREQESQSQIEEEVFGCCHPREGADYWAFEPSVGRMADGVPDWVDRIKGLGNAIVPQIAKLIMDRIKVLL
jgi:DNA (cytosine-5)-methyltransferase 1